MLTKTKIAFAATLILGTASAAMAGSADTEHRGGLVTNASKAAHAGKFSKASARARASYAQDYYVPPSPSTGAVRPLTAFEYRWFDYQDHGGYDEDDFHGRRQ
jgi:hypothetical protein